MTTMLYIETDIPIGMTHAQYRRSRPAPAPSRWRRAYRALISRL